MIRHCSIMFLALILTLGSLIPATAAGRRDFWLGRRHTGNLGDPAPADDICHDPHGQRIACSPQPTSEWFDQLLDHFDATNERTWKQRFYTNSEHYTAGGPVFLLISGDQEATANWMVQGAWVHYAREHKALMFQLEHRFYGQSHPTGDLSTANLEHLSSEQALADLANFIAQMNVRHRLPIDTTRWLAFGGSYAGSLAAWLRLKYPHLVHGAVSSSAPLLAKADFREYYQVLRASLAAYKPACADAVAQAFRQIDIMLRNPVGRRDLSEMFELCDPLEAMVNNPWNVALLTQSLADLFAIVVQFNKEFRHPLSIDMVCDIFMMNQTTGTPLKRLAAFNYVVLLISRQRCRDYRYDEWIAEMRHVSWLAEKAWFGIRQWTYQTCTEFGFYQTSDNATQLFGDSIPLDFFYGMCEDIFGKGFGRNGLQRSIFLTNTNYGALHVQTTNVLYVQGSIDPWHALGLTRSPRPEMPTIYIEGTAHCANMLEPQPDDSPQLKEARGKIIAFVGELLAK